MKKFSHLKSEDQRGKNTQILQLLYSSSFKHGKLATHKLFPTQTSGFNMKYVNEIGPTILWCFKCVVVFWSEVCFPV